MAIEKNSFKVARIDAEYNSPHSPRSRDTLMSSDDEDFQRRNSISAAESDNNDDDDDEFDDCDSGAGSDDFDLLELGETGEEFCQVGDQTCSIPYELYDLPGLKTVLSMEVWNEVLTEEERFGLSKYLPDLDQENFVRTMKELFSGDNLHFGSPIDKLFDMLKGGLCEPRVALYRQGLELFQRTTHFHNLRDHQNAMVNNLCQIRDAWLNCKGYSIEEKLRVLNIVKSQKSLMNENMEGFDNDSSDKEDSVDGLWGRKIKDRKLGQKTGKYSVYSMGPATEISSHGQKTITDSGKHGKKNPRGTLKMAGSRSASTKELSESLTSTRLGVETKSSTYGLGVFASRYKKPVGYDSSGSDRLNEQMIERNGDKEAMYEVAVYRDQNFSHIRKTDKHGASKYRKKYEGPIAEENVDSLMGIPISGRNGLHTLGKNKTINQLSDIKVLTAKPSNLRSIYEGGKKLKYPENHPQLTAENHLKFGKGQKSNSSLKESQIKLVDGSNPILFGRQPGGLFSSDLYGKQSDLNAKPKKWKAGREGVDISSDDKLFHTENKTRGLHDKVRSVSLQNGGRDGAGSRGIRTYSRGEDTETDSSEHSVDGEDDNPLMRSKWAYPGGVPDLKYNPDMKKAKSSKKDKKDCYATLDATLRPAWKMEGYCGSLDMMKSGQKGKMHDVGYVNTLPCKKSDKIYFPSTGNVIGSTDLQQFYPMARNGQVEENHGDCYQMPSFMSSVAVDRRMEGEVHRNSGISHSNYMRDSSFEDDIFWTRSIADNGSLFKSGKKGLMVEPSMGHHLERSDVPLIGCNSLSRKRKIKDESTYLDLRDNCDYLAAGAHLPLDDASMQRKYGKNLLEDTSVADGIEAPLVDVEMEDIEAEAKPPKKPFPLITPTVLTGFSFSIIHLLSAVRMAMVTLLPEDTSAVQKQFDTNDAGQGVEEEKDGKEEDAIVVYPNPNNDANTSAASSQSNVPTLTIQEIVNRVRSNPGDPCILETQEPLQDLVRGVLKIFSSRTAPLGAKGWKPLVIYEKSSKSWSWVGPFSHNMSDSEATEEVTSPDSWGLPHKMLVKLVDSFANWLKNSQDTLQQLGSLPDPPLTLMQINLDEKERFKDLRAQKSLSTISPSSDEVKNYFRKEEVLRYLIPDRAFSYTAVDGKKSIVAPLRRCGGKPTSKARDHFMLKRDRPPHVTILCLVRDAAARLPGSIGTRADVCTLIRDSQYIVEDVSDAQVNQVVSGALDRLHYERDPCVQFDGERKLWVYLHREREEEDFEDDGTSSTKKWRRQKKEATEPSDPGDVTVAHPGPVGHPGYDLVSDLNIETACADDDKRSEPDYHNDNDQAEEITETSNGSDNGMHHPSIPAMWNGLELNSVEGNKLICQENSTNEDFGEDAFGGEPPV